MDEPAGMIFGNFYEGKRVLVTGDTGFKGSWLSEWLLGLGAEVSGISLPPATKPSLFNQLDLGQRIDHHDQDIRDQQAVADLIRKLQPDVLFHLAAQPLVRLSYDTPVETYAVNVMGTVHVLDALRSLKKECAAVFITTDKCYQNREWLQGYREEDPMGGHDPYSASKGAAELVIASYRNSFFPSNGSIRVASARAGNVIGGGDWAKDRIVPDCIRAIRSGTSIPVRNKIATRPWQHVLEPLSGYLLLGANLASSPDPHFQTAFNLGPELASNRTVAQLVAQLISHTGGEWIDASNPDAPHEASKLNLSIDKAFHLLKWQPVWNFEQTLENTASWYLGENSGQNPADLTRSQITAYQSAAAQKSFPWAS
tara:strand:+ start:1086 stop:2192 length:1107 start_codon:yes stop_codon:yes gene_type:complete